MSLATLAIDVSMILRNGTALDAGMLNICLSFMQARASNASPGASNFGNWRYGASCAAARVASGPSAMAALAASSRAAAKLLLHTTRFMSLPLILQLAAQTVAGRRSIPGQKVFCGGHEKQSYPFKM